MDEVIRGFATGYRLQRGGLEREKLSDFNVAVNELGREVVAGEVMEQLVHYLDRSMRERTKQAFKCVSLDKKDNQAI